MPGQEMVAVKPAQVNLIKQTEVEKLLVKLEALSKKPPKACAESEYEDVISDFSYSLIKLAWENAKVSCSQLNTLNKRELVTLADITAVKSLAWRRKAMAWAIAGNLFLVGCITGGIFLIDKIFLMFSLFLILSIPLSVVAVAESSQNKFLSAYRALKARYGNKYFPYKVFNEALLEDDSDDDEDDGD